MTVDRPMPGRPDRDWWVLVGMSLTAISAAISSFSGLRSLALATGWPKVLAPLLPVTVDAYAMTATRVWVAKGSRATQARRFARWNAIMAISLSLIGNAIWHLIAAHVLRVSWPIIVIVGAVPPTMLGLLSHLAVLRGQDEDGPEVGSTQVGTADVLSTDEVRDEAAGVLDPSDPVGDDPAPGQPTDLLLRAQEAESRHRAEHDGRPITRDALRAALRVSTGRASELLRELRKSAGQE